MPAGPDAPTNRLAGEASPYLRLHQHNPVDWYPWGDEALRRARDEDKPIFLSVGYSTCYWCHVMERESFSDPVIARLMNDSFVNIKVDREERPELDEIYMVATQLLAGQGGWPNSVFLTPDLEPYFAGTYFPPADLHGRPGFATVLRSMRDAWQERRADVHAQAESVAGGIRHHLEERAAPTPEVPDSEAARRALSDLERRFDPAWGGFGGAPKFPTPSNLLLLQELVPESPKAAEMLDATLDRMARGGIYDQLGGGFHRYATDREWKVPHFEKMLYDNAWLLELYAAHAARTGDPQSRRVVEETAAWIDREMTGPEGAFWSALDAETDGHEGAFYVWTRQELTAALGEEDATFLAPIYGCDGMPFFEGSHYVLHLPERLEELADKRRTTLEALLADLAPARARLLAARRERPALRTDDKVLADWNGMAIHGLAVAGRLLDAPDLVAHAASAARFVLGALRGEDGTLLHAWRAGRGKVPALLGDYACMTRGLLALHDATGEAAWLESAIALTTEQVARLADVDGGFFVAAEAPDVMVRSKEIFDGAVPSANAVALLNLLRLSEVTGDAAWRDRAAAGLRAFGSVVAERPSAAPMLAVAVVRYHATAALGDRPTTASLGDRPTTAAVDGGSARSPSRASEGRGGVGAQDKGRPAGAPAATPGPLGALVVPTLRLDPDGDFALRLDIAAGWHVYASVPGDPNAVATTLEALEAELTHLDLPPGERWQPSSSVEPVRVYRGAVVLRGRLAGIGEGAALRVAYQACDESRCLAPAHLEVRLT
jgi:uncharacterized protein